MRPENELVDRLDKLFVQLFDLDLLLRPVICAGGNINTVNLLMVLDQGFDGLGRKLERDLVAEDQVDMDDVCINMQQLIVENGLDQWVRVLPQIRIWRLL